jgi:hypothetical protein
MAIRGRRLAVKAEPEHEHTADEEVAFGKPHKINKSQALESHVARCDPFSSQPMRAPRCAPGGLGPSCGRHTFEGGDFVGLCLCGFPGKRIL